MALAKRAIWSVLYFTAVVACGRKAGPERDAVQEPTGGVQPPASTAAGPLCPRTGHWGECQLRIRLEQSGLAPVVTKEKVGDLPAATATPVLFQVGNAGIAAYFFPDTLARRTAAAALDTTKFIAPSRAVGIHAEATAIESDNALVILFSRNEHQRERVSDAITAGPPQP
ncbi:MAG: hypothetical protein ABJE47_05920 [bacterium]